MHDIFYFTDVHGMYDLYRAAMNYCLEQDPECSIVFGGDACDRGKDGYKIMRELLDNPQVLYLKGNHEDMFVHAAWSIKRNYKGELTDTAVRNYLINCCYPETYNSDIALVMRNDGVETLVSWMLDGMPEDFVLQIHQLPLTMSYENIDFCHAGGNFNTFVRVSSAEYHENFVDKGDIMIVLWDRNYLSQGWYPDRTCVFGHTPTPYLAAKYYGKDKSISGAHPCAYVGQLDDKWTGRKIDMDTGAFASGKLYVLNVLTMQAQGFYDKDCFNDENPKHIIEKIECIQF